MPQARVVAPDEEVCGVARAYARKLGKAERKRREEEARREARTDLAERALAEALPGRRTSAPSRPLPASLRLRYRVVARLADGLYRLEGTKRDRSAAYCVAREQYARVVGEIRAERAAAVESILARFARLERQIHSAELRAASTELTSLEIAIVVESLEHEEHVSAIDGRIRPLYVWLLEWGDSVERGPEYVRFMTARARELLDAGHLDEADRYVFEALEDDRDDAEARRLRERIQLLRNRYVDLLRDGERLARGGRFRRAEQRLEQARHIGSDDPLPLERTEKTVSGLRAAHLEHNPLRRVLVYGALGTLGADTGRIARRVGTDQELPLDGSAPLSLGAGATFRLGRLLAVGVTGSWGVSQDRNLSVGGSPLELYQVFQLTAGAGWRRPRRAGRRLAWRVDAGPVWERIRAHTVLPSDRDASDGQAALFIRFAVETSTVSLFVQHGIGFRDEPGSLVGWSNRLQFGIGGSF